MIKESSHLGMLLKFLSTNNIINSKSVCFIVSFFLYLLVGIISNVSEFPYDSGYYLSLAASYGLFENFDILHFSSSLRGYLYPLLLYPVILISNIGIGTIAIDLLVINSFVYSLLSSLIIPYFFEKVFAVKFRVYARYVFSIIFLFFFRGLIIYPLSDLPAIFFIFVAAILTQKIYSEIKMPLSLYKCLIGLLCGVCLASAYYIRPIYLISIIAWIILSIIVIMINRKPKMLILVAFMLIGLALIASPQIYINTNNYDTVSPLILTEKSYDGDSLYLEQLGWGIYISKYETNMDLSHYPSASLKYIDQTGLNIYNNNQIDSYIDYILLFLSHPLDMCCIYLLHLFNGLDITYPSIYIYDLYDPLRTFTQLFNYTLLFIGIVGCVNLIKRTRYHDSLVVIGGMLLLPILLVIPTAVETRFFAILSIIFYGLATITITNIDLKDAINKSRKYILYYVGFIIICFILNHQVFSLVGIPHII